MFPLAPAASPRPRRGVLAAIALLAAASGALTTAAVLRATPPPAAPAPVVVPVPVAVLTPAPAPQPPPPAASHCWRDPHWGQGPALIQHLVGHEQLGAPWHWFKTMLDCRGQIVQLAATDRVRVVILDRGVARVVEHLELAVPRAIDHFQWDASIDLLVGDQRDLIAVVGHDATDHHRVLARVSTDGGWTWTTRELGTTDRRIDRVRMTDDGEITFERRANAQRLP
jgi:hypothetical protein